MEEESRDHGAGSEAEGRDRHPGGGHGSPGQLSCISVRFQVSHVHSVGKACAGPPGVSSQGDARGCEQRPPANHP